MRAWVVTEPAPISEGPLQLTELPRPEPGQDEVLVRVSACGVCRTDLHLAEGDLPPKRPRTVPGHEVVGHVAARGADADRFAVGDRVGIAWLRRTCGRCRYCVRGDENLCERPEFTGWDADGGYAEYAVVPESFAYPLPPGPPDVSLAPLLCAGIIGYRSLRRSGLRAGGVLGVYGYGASAHLASQIAIRDMGARVHVFTRAPEARQLALSHGCTSAGDSFDPTPEPLDAAILFAPAGEILPAALRALDRGGTLACAGIYLSDIPAIHYAEELFYEKNLVSVTANTRADGRAFLAAADRVHLRPTVTPYPFEQADRALADLAADRVTGAAVLELSDGP